MLWTRREGPADEAAAERAPQRRRRDEPAEAAVGGGGVLWRRRDEPDDELPEAAAEASVTGAASEGRGEAGVGSDERSASVAGGNGASPLSPNCKDQPT